MNSSGQTSPAVAPDSSTQTDCTEPATNAGPPQCIDMTANVLNGESSHFEDTLLNPIDSWELVEQGMSLPRDPGNEVSHVQSIDSFVQSFSIYPEGFNLLYSLTPCSFEELSTASLPIDTQLDPFYDWELLGQGVSSSKDSGNEPIEDHSIVPFVQPSSNHIESSGWLSSLVPPLFGGELNSGQPQLDELRSICADSLNIRL